MTTTENDLKATARDAAESAKAMARDAAQTARTQAELQAERAKSGIAGEVNDVARGLRDAAATMRSGSAQEQMIGHLADTLADVSENIKGQNLGEMLDAATEFARRNPVTFLGGAALAGFALTRFAKASDRARAQEQAAYADGYGRAPSYGAHPTGTTAPGVRPTPVSAAGGTGTPGASASTSGKAGGSA